MEPEEVIKILNNLHDQCSQADNIFCTDVIGARCEALDFAMEIVEKQIPKNPITNGNKNINWAENALLCPDCNQYFGSAYDEGFCRTCGRKIVQRRIRVI